MELEITLAVLGLLTLYACILVANENTSDDEELEDI